MSGPDIIWCTKVSFHCRKVPELGQTDESPEDSTRHAEINKQLLKISRLNLLLPLLCSARFYGLWPNSCPALKIPPRTQDIRLKCRHIAPKAGRSSEKVANNDGRNFLRQETLSEDITSLLTHKRLSFLFLVGATPFQVQ